MLLEMTTEEQRDLFKNALLLACKYCREHPPAALPGSIDEIMLIAGGVNDPEGARFLKYFLDKAMEMKCE